MPTVLHVEFDYTLTGDDEGHMVAVVTGYKLPDQTVEETLRETGGTWENRVTWSLNGDYYLVSGEYGGDPNYGDTPGGVVTRLRRAGNLVTVTIHHPDGTTYE